MQFRFFERFGKYVFLEKLGRGGMAEVYLAAATNESGVNDFYAVKKIVSEKLKQQTYIDLFQDEAELAIQLRHKNIVPVHDFGFENAQFYLVMEHMQGTNLAGFQKAMKTRRKLLPIVIAVHIMKEIAEGLDYAHHANSLITGEPLNIIHRDINPQNVMMSYTGEVKIIDFGVAKATSQTESTQSTGLVGKYQYMPPEMILGHKLDGRSDIFSYGTIFWEMIARQKLFEGETEKEILEKIKLCQLPTLKKLNPFVAIELENIIYKCLKLNPAERYQNTKELLQDLNFYLTTFYSDFTPGVLQTFLKELYSEEVNELQGKLKKYSNLHFDEASGDAALAVPKEFAEKLTSKQAAGGSAASGSEKTKVEHSEARLSKASSRASEMAVPSAFSIKPFRRKQSRKDKIAFSKELYTSTRFTQESLLHQDLKLRIIYISIFVCLFLIFGFWTHKKNSRLHKLAVAQINESTKDVKMYSIPMIATMSAKEQQACFITLSNQLYCWGKNDYGQLGFGRLSAFEGLSEIGTDLKFKNISLGNYHACAVTKLQMGTEIKTPLKCWGDNSYGQVGDPTSKLSLVPITVDAGVNYTDVSVGQLHTCGLTQEKTVKCWGQGLFGQLGSTTVLTSQKPILVPLTEKIQQIASGSFHTCALSETGHIYCWGRNDAGQVGYGAISEKLLPTRVQSASIFKQVSAGDHHTCAITSEGAAACWGKNEFGQLGNGTAEPAPRPSFVLSSRPFIQISSGKNHNCAVDINKNLWCWGRNDQGQIAQIPEKFVRRPYKLKTQLGLAVLALGETFTCWGEGASLSCQGEHKVFDLRKAASE